DVPIDGGALARVERETLAEPGPALRRALGIGRGEAMERVQQQRALPRRIAPVAGGGDVGIRVGMQALPALDLGDLRLAERPRQPAREPELPGAECEFHALAAPLCRQRALLFEPLEGAVAFLRLAHGGEPASQGRRRNV